jgi:hypothetical protein
MHQIAYSIPKIFRGTNPRNPVGWGPRELEGGRGKGRERGREKGTTSAKIVQNSAQLNPFS